MSSISSVSSASAVSYIAPTTTTTASQQTDDTAQAGGTKFSKMGELMSKLQDLAKSDPDKAKAVMAKISQDLKAKADSSGDKRMAELADKFGQAAQSGDLSVLKPKEGGGGHHHHSGTPSGQTGAYQAQQSSMSDIEDVISSDLSS